MANCDMLADDVYPPSVDITADTLKVWMDTQIALGKFASQPDYETFVGAQTHRARARDE